MKENNKHSSLATDHHPLHLIDRFQSACHHHPTLPRRYHQLHNIQSYTVVPPFLRRFCLHLTRSSEGGHIVYLAEWMTFCWVYLLWRWPIWKRRPLATHCCWSNKKNKRWPNTLFSPSQQQQPTDTAAVDEGRLKQESEKERVDAKDFYPPPPATASSIDDNGNEEDVIRSLECRSAR